MPPFELIVAAFDNSGQAAEALASLRELQREGLVGIVNAAVLVKDADGKTHLRETEDVRAPGGALFGAIAGALVGLLGGPAGAIVGAAAGAATGGLAAHNLDMGFSDDMLKDIQSSLPANSSAILALISHEWVDRIIAELEALRARLYRQGLKDELLSQLPASSAPDEKPAAPDKPAA
jgi:uncharacterized membrane protein